MNRKSSIIIIVCIVIALAVLYFAFRGNDAVSIPRTTEEGVAGSNVWQSEILREESIDESGNGYTISAQYPLTESATVTGYFRTFVEETIAQFKKDTSWVSQEARPEENNLVLQITYTREKGTFSDNYLFQTEMYTGGAHGLQVTKTFTFLPDGTPLTIPMLFTTGEKGLQTIAPFVQKELLTREFTTEEWVKEGTLPIEQNYQNFVVGDTGITFIFDPYQVASYAAGVQKVTVPLSVFKKIANTEVFGE